MMTTYITIGRNAINQKNPCRLAGISILLPTFGSIGGYFCIVLKSKSMAKKGKARLEELQRRFRRKKPEDECCKYQKLLRKRKIQMWLDFLEIDEDFGY